MQNTLWLILDHLWAASFHRGGGRVLWRPIIHHPRQSLVSTRSQQLRRHTRTHACLQSLLQLEESIICMNYFLQRSALDATMWVGGITLVLCNLDEPSHFFSRDTAARIPCIPLPPVGLGRVQATRPAQDQRSQAAHLPAVPAVPSAWAGSQGNDRL